MEVGDIPSPQEQTGPARLAVDLVEAAEVFALLQSCQVHSEGTGQPLLHSSLRLCLSFSLSIYVSIYLSISVSLYLSIYLSLSLSLCLSLFQ
jgi:hypothetical protein